MNFPTIVYFDLNLYEIRPESCKMIEILKAANIFHDNVTSASIFLDSINYDVGKWWFSVDVQKARTLFCDNYGKTSKSWMKEWRIILNKFYL